MATRTDLNSLSTSFLNDQIARELITGNYFVLLGNSNINTNVSGNQNTVDSYNEVAANSIVAKKIKNSDIKRGVRVPTGVDGRWILNKTKPSPYSSGGQIFGESNWPLYVYEGIVYLILGNDTIYDRIDYDFPSARNPLTVNDGSIAKNADGFRYVAVAAIPDREIFETGKNFIPFRTAKEEYDYIKNSSDTTIKNKTINICGAGNENRPGTCCLYYREGEYNPVMGISHAVGEYSHCLETTCEECVRIAGRMSMDLSFNRWSIDSSSPTGFSGPRCNLPTIDTSTDCGPCSCDNGTTTTIHIDEPLEKFSSNTSSYKNSRIAKKIKKYAGGIASVRCDLSNLTRDQRKLSSSYTGSLNKLPMISYGGGSKADIDIIVEKDSNQNEYILGFKVNNTGSGYGSVQVDTESLSSILPNLSTTEMNKRIYINVIPSVGFHEGLPEIFNISTLLEMELKNDEISSITNAIDFDFWGIGTGNDENGTPIFSGVAPEEESSISLTTTITARKVGTISLTASDLSSVSSSSTFSSKTSSTSSSSAIKKKDKIVSTKSIATGTIQSEIATKNIDSYSVGSVLQDSDDNDWTVLTKTDITSPTTGDKVDLDSITINHRVPTNITIQQSPSTSGGPTIRSSFLRIYLGNNSIQT